MKILFQSRKNLFSVPGGYTVQILKTAEKLRSMGYSIDISTELEPDVADYDIVHLFNLMRPQEIYLQIKNAKKHKKGVALSTIYGSYIEYERKDRGGIGGLLSRILNHYQVEYLKVIARSFKNKEIHKGTVKLIFNGYRRLQTRIIKMTQSYLSLLCRFAGSLNW